MKIKMIQLDNIMQELRQHMPELEQRYKVKELGIFGSYVHGKQNKESDLDILVEFYDPPGLIEYVEMRNHLSDLLGVKIDLVMKDALKPAISTRVLSEVIIV
jgi:uncharacterized protein